mgnify:FL=1
MVKTSTSIFDTLLNSGEKLLWSGKPRQGFLLHRSDVFFIPFSLVWAVIAGWLEYGTLVSPLPLEDKLWSFFSLFVAAYILVLRFVVDLLSRYFSFYALTDKRLLIHTGFLKTTLLSLPLAEQKEINLDLRKDGSGDIVFGPLDPKSWMYTGGGWPKFGENPPPAFVLLKDAEKIYKLILSQQKKVK